MSRLYCPCTCSTKLSHDLSVFASSIMTVVNCMYMTSRQSDRQVGRQTDGRTHRKTERHMDGQTHELRNNRRRDHDRQATVLLRRESIRDEQLRKQF